MQHAIYTLDNSQQTPQQFAALSPHELAQRRNHLACPGCSGHTFFRSETRNGRAPCFCGHHQAGCEYAAAQSGAKNPGQRVNRDACSPHEQRIVVDLAYGAAPMDGFAQSLESEYHREQRSRSAGFGGNHTAITHRRPSSILKDLVLSSQFGASNQALEIAGLEVTTVADFFVQFERIESRHVGQFHGYWGAISRVRRGMSNELWLNTYSRFDMSICIPRHMVEAFQMRFKNHDRNDLTGPVAFCLVFGVLQIAASSKPYIEVNDLCLVAVCDISAL